MRQKKNTCTISKRTHARGANFSWVNIYFRVMSALQRFEIRTTWFRCEILVPQEIRFFMELLDQDWAPSGTFPFCFPGGFANNLNFYCFLCSSLRNCSMPVALPAKLALQRLHFRSWGLRVQMRCCAKNIFCHSSIISCRSVENFIKTH